MLNALRRPSDRTFPSRADTHGVGTHGHPATNEPPADVTAAASTPRLVECPQHHDAGLRNGPTEGCGLARGSPAAIRGSRRAHDQAPPCDHPRPGDPSGLPLRISDYSSAESAKSEHPFDQTRPQPDAHERRPPALEASSESASARKRPLEAERTGSHHVQSTWRTSAQFSALFPWASDGLRGDQGQESEDRRSPSPRRSGCRSSSPLGPARYPPGTVRSSSRT